MRRFSERWAGVSLSVAVILPHGPLVDALDAMRARARAGEVQAPERSGIALPRDGVLLLMPAADREHACVKLVSVHPHNPAAQLPVIHGTVLLMRADTGERLLMTFSGVIRKFTPRA